MIGIFLHPVGCIDYVHGNIGTYDIRPMVDNFDLEQRFEINIVDPVQSIKTLLTGKINFIASKEENYWYLYLRDPRKGDIVGCWPKTYLHTGHCESFKGVGRIAS